MPKYLWGGKASLFLLQKKQSVITFSSYTSPKVTKAWCLDNYNEKSLLLEDVLLPSDKSLKPTEVLVKVKAASLNPFDSLMRNGFGSVVLDNMRRWNRIKQKPVILGRDFSGVVVKKGKLVSRVKEGDEVWGTPAVWRPGTFAEYCCVNHDELALKPKCLNHVEAASFPYVLCTVWSALCDTAGISKDNARKKRVFIVGGSGGIGSTAIQLMKSWGAHVTSTCSEDAIELLESFGTDHIIDYNNENVAKKISDDSHSFDAILDSVGGNLDQFANIPSCHGSTYVLLAPPLLNNIDQSGIFLGSIRSAVDFLTPAISKHLSSSINYQWAYFKPNPAALNILNMNISKGKIFPVIDSVFHFSELPKAFDKLDNGHLRGKVVLNIDTPS